MERFAARIAHWPLAGITITLMAVFAQWGRNTLRLGFESAWPTLAAAAGLALLVTAGLRLVCRSWMRAGLAAAMVAVGLFYVPVVLALLSWPYAAKALLFVGAIAALCLIWLRLPKGVERLEPIAWRLNLLLLVLLGLTIAPIAVQQVQLEPNRTSALASLGELEGRASADSPDVWHIVFDRYAASDTLKQQYGFDNGPFLDALRQRGFVVREPAWSNYQRTGHSIASTMNGVLLDPMTPAMSAQPSDWVPIYRAMRDGAAVRLFNRMGYRTVFAGSWWEPTRFSSTAAQTIRIRAMPQLARVTLDQSAIGFWLRGRQVPWLDGRSDQCFRANEKFRRLRDLAGDPARKFVFAHFLVPHPPFVLNPDGSCRLLAEARGASRTANYLAQVQFANREVLALIDAILAGPRPAMIVIHSDEGPWPEPYVGDEHGLGTDPVPVPWSSLTPAQLHEKMAILLAVRDPSGQTPRTMPASPVQIYPALLRDHFASQQALPPSRHKVFTGDDALYRFEDVSERLARD